MIRIPNAAGSGHNIECRRIVVKLGSNVVMGDGGQVDRTVLDGLAKSLVAMREEKVEVILVTSGAVALACGQLGKPRPKTIPEKQAFAAIGQIGLMHTYQGILAARGLAASQILLTRSDMEDRRRYLNARHAMDHLLHLGAVPIINENDTISTDELSFGDNDMLSAYVAVKMKADLLVLLSTAPGLLRDVKGSEIVRVVERLDSKTFGMADDSRSGHGSGGMKSKLEAARIATDAGIHAIIAGGKTPKILDRVISGDFPGTLFCADSGRRLSAMERWIGYGRSTRGNKLTLDDGAVEALLKKKTSLLPVGVAAVAGDFKPGDIVEICDRAGNYIARGLAS